MPILYATDPRRLGYVCDDYDMPVRDLLTDKCYPNYCVAEAAGVKNWDYECNIDIRFPAPIDEAQAAPPGTFVYGGGDDGSGWDGGSSWIGGSPWRRRRPGAPPSGGGRSGGGGPGGTGPSASPPSTPPGRSVDWRPSPGRTIFRGASTPSSGSGIHTNPAGTTGGGVTLVGDGTQSTNSTLATTPGRGGATLIGDGTQAGGSTLARAMQQMQLVPQLQRAAPMRETTQYQAAPQHSTAVTTRRDDRQYQASSRPSQTALTTSSGKATLTTAQRSGLTSRGGGGRVSRAMHGLGDFTTQTLPGAVLLFGGALIVGSYLATR